MREGLLIYLGGYEWNVGEVEVGDGVRLLLYWVGLVIRM